MKLYFPEHLCAKFVKKSCKMSKKGFFIRDILENNGSSGEQRPEVEQPLITFPNFLGLPTPNIMAYPGMFNLHHLGH